MVCTVQHLDAVCKERRALSTLSGSGPNLPEAAHVAAMRSGNRGSPACYDDDSAFGESTAILGRTPEEGVA